MSSKANATLIERLAEALPKGSCFQIYHLSSPPTPCAAIYSAPPGEKQEKTFCESHFFSVSIDSGSLQLQVFALEVLLYTTENLTTLFVSKADSTGYLHLLKLPKGAPSHLKTISTTFLAYLVEKRRRSDRKLVLSLFARAQDQYLFPGSIENSGKHVLDDRGLVKWWCKVLDPILRLYPGEDSTSGCRSRSASNNRTKPDTWIVGGTTGKGYLKIPGCDLWETRSFFTDRSKYAHLSRRWNVGDPLRDLGRSPHWPERCLIPRFPDDPKARYVEELDDELPEPTSHTQESPSKGKHPGQWNSVKRLEQFWEMMAFRQECSSGRLVGFIWGVFQPSRKIVDGDSDNLEPSLATLRQQKTTSVLPTPGNSRSQDSTLLDSALRSDPMPELPLPSSSSSSTSNTEEKREPRRSKALPEKTRSYYWPLTSRGEVVLREKDYQRVNKLMLHLDYANKNIAAESTKMWVNDVSVMAGKSWGQSVVGNRDPEVVSQAVVEQNATVLDTGPLRKKKRDNDDVEGQALPVGGVSEKNEVNVLSVGLVRKKPKVESNSCFGKAPD